MRILSGQFRGREILPPPGKSITRPVTGLVKKSLFSMLGEELPGQTVLDLYCGTGTMGLECLSRGAKRCFFAEKDPRVVERLARNLRDLRVTDRATIWRGDVEARLASWLIQVTDPVDVAFVDPPYADARFLDWSRTAETIFVPLAPRLSDNDGCVVLRTDEHAAVPDELGGLQCSRTKNYGDMVVRFFVKTAATSHKPPATSHKVRSVPG